MHPKSFHSLLFSLLTLSTTVFGVPIVTNLNPNFGPSAGGNSINITGTGFSGTSIVLFGSTISPGFIVNSDTSITAIVPPRVFGDVDVTVITPGGTSPITHADLYAYQGNWSAYVTTQALNSVGVIFIPTNTITGSVPASSATILAITPDGKTVYVTDENISGSVTAIDVLTNTVAATIPVSSQPFGIAISPDGKKVYVGCYSGGTIDVIDTSSNTVITSIPIGTQALAVAFTPDGTKAYVAFGTSPVGQVTVIDVASSTVSTSFPVGNNLQDIAITPDGTKAYVTSAGAPNEVFVIDTTLNTIITVIPVGTTPTGVAITPDGKKAYIAERGSNSVTVIDTTLDVIFTTISLTPNGGIGPVFLAVTPDNKTVYVTNTDSNNVLLIDVATDTLDPTVISFPAGAVLTSIEITPDQAPIASFKVSAFNTFDASASVSPVGTIALYVWNFGDGQTAITTSPVITHNYAAPGLYTVTLTVINSAGTSTTEVFTGKTASRNGGPSATTSLVYDVFPLPANLSGCEIRDSFASQTAFIHFISWTPSPDPIVVGYQLFRNGVLIATIAASEPPRFFDLVCKENERDVYSLVAFTAAGLTAPPITLTFNPKMHCCPKVR